MITYKWNKDFFNDYMNRIDNLENIQIVSAFFSEYGVDLLREVVTRNKLKKEDVEVCISSEFSTKNAVSILEELSKFATVYIVFEIKLHAKAYFFRKRNGEIEFIQGSANFTKGGLINNLELMCLHYGEEVNEVVINSFFDYCKNNAEYLTSDIIDFYRENEELLKKLELVQNQFKKKIKRFTRQDDLFQKEDYNIEDYYFTYEDYETFFPRNVSLKTNDIKNRRIAVQDKMLSIHKLLNRYMKELNLHPHWNSNHITSLIDPSFFNHHRVSWLGIRYGKNKYEVQQLNTGLERAWNSYRNSYENNEFMGFQKHACIQFSLSGNSFEIILFHAVANDAVDRTHLWGLIDEMDKEKLETITKKVKKLKNKGFTWYITDAKNGKLIDKFDFDSRDPSEFLNFYKHADDIGYESFCAYSINPDDEILKSKKEIAKLVLRKTKELLPLYEEITFRFSKDL